MNLCIAIHGKFWSAEAVGNTGAGFFRPHAGGCTRPSFTVSVVRACSRNPVGQERETEMGDRSVPVLLHNSLSFPFCIFYIHLSVIFV